MKRFFITIIFVCFIKFTFSQDKQIDTSLFQIDEIQKENEKLLGLIGINCELGANFQDIKHSVVLLQIHDDNSQEACPVGTGVLVNNVGLDRTPYILTAGHVVGNYSGGQFIDVFFNYETDNCDVVNIENPVLYDNYQSLSTLGVEVIYVIAQNINQHQYDYALIKLNEQIPASFNVYYIGWDRTTSLPTELYSINHSKGYSKSICSFSDLYYLDANIIVGTNVIEGTIYDGASGSPFIDENDLLKGNYQGGPYDNTWPGHWAMTFSKMWKNPLISSPLSGWNVPNAPTTLQGMYCVILKYANIANPIYGNTVVQADLSLTANSKINSGTVYFQSKEITLNPGFEVAVGASFEATYLSCPSANPSKEEISVDSGFVVINTPETYANFLKNTSNQIIGKSTLISEICENSITLFPNPVVDEINISSEINEITSMKIVNLQGIVIFENEYNQNEINLDLSYLNAGIYFVQIITKKGITTQKIIKN
jgi:hypothetical protein